MKDDNVDGLLTEEELESQKDMHAQMIRHDGCALEHVPLALKSPEICLAAVTANPWALKFVPEPVKSEALCLRAVRYVGRTLEFVPEALRTGEICRLAVLQDARALAFVPPASIREILPELLGSGAESVREIGFEALAIGQNEVIRAMLRDDLNALDELCEDGIRFFCFDYSKRNVLDAIKREVELEAALPAPVHAQTRNRL